MCKLNMRSARFKLASAASQVAQKTNADLLALWEGLTDAPTAEDTDATLDTVVQQLNADFEAWTAAGCAQILSSVVNSQSWLALTRWIERRNQAAGMASVHSTTQAAIAYATHAYQLMHALCHQILLCTQGTRLEALHWVNVLLQRSRTVVMAHHETLLPALFDALNAPSDRVVEEAVAVQVILSHRAVVVLMGGCAAQLRPSTDARFRTPILILLLLLDGTEAGTACRCILPHQ